ncbi:MAG: ABC transporter transmembrane domain-containing protein [Paenibacillaceae bacterium]
MSWFFKLRWKSYTMAILAMIADFSIALTPPLIMGDLIDMVNDGTLTQELLDYNVLLLVGIAITTYALVLIWVNVLFRNAMLAELMMRSKLIRHLILMTPTFFQRNSRGDLMAQATNDIRAVNFAAGFGVMTLVHTVVGCILVLTMMIIFVDYRLMLAALIPMPFLALAIRKLGMAMRTRFVAAQQAFGALNDQALESISGIRVIRSYVQEGYDVEAFRKVAEDTMSKNVRVSIIHGLFHPVISLLVGLSFSIGLGVGSYMMYLEIITLGQFVQFNIFLGMLIWPMIAFGEFMNVMQRGSASADRIHHTLIQEADVVDVDSPVTDVIPDRISFNRMSFRYPEASEDSLADIEVYIDRGQTLGVVGRTGSGKSTFLKQLLRQYPITGNSLLIGGISIEQISFDQIHEWMGYVPQEYLLLSKTIRDNVRLGKLDATAEEVDDAVHMASLSIDIAQMKDGLETMIGENGLMLSGGQKQRVGIARALLVDPEILILDDALSAVDARTESAILHNIRHERHGRTTIIATHRLSAVSHADWIIVLDDGRIVEEGTHDQLMFLGGWYKEQYERQQIEASLL